MDHHEAARDASSSHARGGHPQRLLMTLPDELLRLILAPHHAGAGSACRRLCAIVLVNIQACSITCTDKRACTEGLDFAAAKLPLLTHLALRTQPAWLQCSSPAFGPLSRLARLTSLCVGSDAQMLCAASYQSAQARSQKHDSPSSSLMLGAPRTQAWLRL